MTAEVGRFSCWETRVEPNGFGNYQGMKLGISMLLEGYFELVRWNRSAPLVCSYSVLLRRWVYISKRDIGRSRSKENIGYPCLLYYLFRRIFETEVSKIVWRGTWKIFTRKISDTCYWATLLEKYLTWNIEFPVFRRDIRKAGKADQVCLYESKFSSRVIRNYVSLLLENGAPIVRRVRSISLYSTRRANSMLYFALAAATLLCATFLQNVVSLKSPRFLVHASFKHSNKSNNTCHRWPP